MPTEFRQQARNGVERLSQYGKPNLFNRLRISWGHLNSMIGKAAYRERLQRWSGRDRVLGPELRVVLIQIERVGMRLPGSTALRIEQRRHSLSLFQDGVGR